MENELPSLAGQAVRSTVPLNRDQAIVALDLINEANRVNQQYNELAEMLGPGRVPLTIGDTTFDMDYSVMLRSVEAHLDWIMAEARKYGVQIELDPVTTHKLNRVA